VRRNGVVWFIGFFVGFVLWPFATVALQQATGSFALAFLTIPVFMVVMAAGVWFIVPEHAGKELNAIAVLSAENGPLRDGVPVEIGLNSNTKPQSFAGKQSATTLD
jgi:hypothetical protein